MRLIRYTHEQAFDARPEVKSLIVDGERSAIEVDFVGRHTAEFAGIPATGRDGRCVILLQNLTTGHRGRSAEACSPAEIGSTVEAITPLMPLVAEHRRGVSAMAGSRGDHAARGHSTRI